MGENHMSGLVYEVKPTRHWRGGFTLIELLVVIAIIAILAAMLLPALSKARYRAKLTICQGQLRDSGQALIMYAGDFDAFYPYRDAGTDGVFHAVKPLDTDWRPLYRPYRDLNTMFICPLVPNTAHDIDGSTAGAVYSSYMVFAGAQLSGTGDKSMLRTGETMVRNGNVFRVLMADVDRTKPGANRVTSHPDTLMTELTRDDASYTYSWWWNGTGTTRLPIAQPFLFDDGRVEIYFAFAAADSRARDISIRMSDSAWPRRTWLPPE
jgi:prepilin-type N-terminal cleavage/methylation domain-containing protein